MLLPSLVAVALVSAAPKLATPGINGVRIEPEVAEFYAEHLAQRFTDHGVRVVTQKEISTLIGLERQRQLSGCGENQSQCLIELANALGVDGTLIGEVAHIGEVFQLNLRVLAATDAHVMASYTGRVDREDKLLDELDRAAVQMTAQLLGKSSADPAATVSVETGAGHRSLRSYAWIPAAAGGVLAASGAALLFVARNDHQQLVGSGPPSLSEKDAAGLRNGGATAQTAGNIALGVGVAGLLAGGAMYLFGGESQPVAAIVPDGRGIGFAVGGTF